MNTPNSLEIQGGGADLSFLFSFYGRIGRREFAKYGIGSIVAFLFLAGSNGSQPEPSPLIGLISIIPILTFISAVTRRSRDIGSSGFWLFIFVFFNVAFYLVSWLWLVIMKSWDQRNGLNHVLALLKHISRTGGVNVGATASEVAVFSEIGSSAFGFPEHIMKRALADFTSTTAPSHTAAFHARKLRTEPNVTPEMLTGTSQMLMAIAAANGQPTSEKLKLVDEINAELGISAPLPPGIPEVIGLAAKIAKADGRVSQEEVDTIDQFLRYGVGLSNEMRREAIAVFTKAKDDQKSYQSYADACASTLIDELAKELAFRVLLDIALADGDLHEKETEILEYVAKVFGIEHGFSGSNSSQGQSGQSAQDEDGSTFGHKGEAYYAKILEIDPGADADTIKTAYRQHVRKNHPDQVKNMSEAIQTFASEELKKINEAYEFFKSRNRV